MGEESLGPVARNCEHYVRQIVSSRAQDWKEQIQFLLGQVSIQTTERYLGCKQRIQGAVNDKIGIEPPD